MNITDVGHLQSDNNDGDDKMLLASKKITKIQGKLHIFIRYGRFWNETV
jgi:hypothetical protein